MSERRVVITGFMGAGKTTVANALARLLKDSFIDIDESVTKIEGRTPQQLIDEEGEEFFREAETRALRLALEEGPARVIATGGGAWTMRRNRALVAAGRCLSVWLDAPFELCWRRITASGGGTDRPLARNPERARRLYEERLAAYRLADLHVSVTPHKSADELADEIAVALGTSG
ncbi:MAG: shikimate kinase [Acidobacteriota bacterium]|jgi:shikimate kinase|nr:shikimate kinase [Acidobacteriota bacterium]